FVTETATRGRKYTMPVDTAGQKSTRRSFRERQPDSFTQSGGAFTRYSGGSGISSIRTTSSRGHDLARRWLVRRQEPSSAGRDAISVRPVPSALETRRPVRTSADRQTAAHATRWRR